MKFKLFQDKWKNKCEINNIFIKILLDNQQQKLDFQKWCFERPSQDTTKEIGWPTSVHKHNDICQNLIDNQ